jgi:hypothetical protein
VSAQRQPLAQHPPPPLRAVSIPRSRQKGSAYKPNWTSRRACPISRRGTSRRRRRCS